MTSLFGVVTGATQHSTGLKSFARGGSKTLHFSLVFKYNTQKPYVVVIANEVI